MCSKALHRQFSPKQSHNTYTLTPWCCPTATWRVSSSPFNSWQGLKRFLGGRWKLVLLLCGDFQPCRTCPLTLLELHPGDVWSSWSYVPGYELSLERGSGDCREETFKNWLCWCFIKLWETISDHWWFEPNLLAKNWPRCVWELRDTERAQQRHPRVLCACFCGCVWRPLRWTRIFLCEATCCHAAGVLYLSQGARSWRRQEQRWHRGDTGGHHKEWVTSQGCHLHVVKFF